MKLVVEIDEATYKDITKGKGYSSFRDVPQESVLAIANGIPLDEPLDEKELKLKRWIEKDIEMLNEIIESGWLISDYDKCTAIDACEDAITALKQYPVLDKVRAEIENDWQLKKYPSSPFSCGLRQAIEIIDKYRAESEGV